MADKDKDIEAKTIGFKELHKKGKLNYVIRYGILSWGVSVTIIVRIMISIATYKLDIKRVLGSFFSLDTVYTLITFSILGGIWGRIMWGWLEKEVKRQNQKQGKKGNKKKHKK